MARYTELAVLLVSIMLAGVFGLTGGMKLFGSADMVVSFARWGYGPGFMYAVGAFEVLCAAALLVPRANFLGAAGVALVMAGAIWTHVAHAEYAVIVVPIGLLLLAAGLAWTTRPQALGGPVKLRHGEFAAAMPDEHERPLR